jgi:hypothetical protein
MVGQRKKQRSLFEVGNVFDVALDSNSFYGQLAKVAPELFDDEIFSCMYSSGKGRPSVPPSQLALLLLLQARDGVSDQEAVDRARYDCRWAVVLGCEIGAWVCAKSTLQLFRAHLILHGMFGQLLQGSLNEARRKGLLKGQHLAAVADTKPMLGRGAVEDTYNLLATAMRQLARAVAASNSQSLEDFLAQNDLARLGAVSIKGSVSLDWSNVEARQAFLTGLCADARRLLELADGGEEGVKEAASLLEQIMLQDVEIKKDEDGNPRASIKAGTAKGRIPSATDPEQRHGHKSKSKHFTGSKASVLVEEESGLALSVSVLPGDAGDATGVLGLVQEGEINSGSAIHQVMGDCAYGNGATRQELIDAGKEMVAKVPAESRQGNYFPKSEFHIELPPAGQSLEETKVTCPAGKQAQYLTPHKSGGITFYFNEACDRCPLRSQCTSSRYGRSIKIHPQEALMKAARAFQRTCDGAAKLRRRLVVENALARLSHLGIGQARYKGNDKCRFQLTLAATVANLRRTWNWAAQSVKVQATPNGA